MYLDHAAATPMDRRVQAAMEPYFSELFFNPSSPYAPAINVRQQYEAAKQRIAQAIGAKADELVLTAGATESINLALGSVPGHAITLATEHHSVLRSIEARPEYTIVGVDEQGTVLLDELAAAIRPTTTLLSIALANNEVGTIQPLRAITTLVRTERARRLAAGETAPLYIHCDASQGVGLLDVHVSRLGVDMLTINAGKIYGPKQVGLLWSASTVLLTPTILGGGQERGLRSGTENVAGAVGFAVAIERVSEHRKFEHDRLLQLRDQLASTLTAAFPDIVVSGHTRKQLPNFLHVSLPGLDAERLLFSLERREVFVATGSACAANKGTRSHVLTAMGLAPAVADGSLRMTLGQLSTDDSIQRAGQIIVEEIQKEYERVAR